MLKEARRVFEPQPQLWTGNAPATIRSACSSLWMSTPTMTLVAPKDVVLRYSSPKRPRPRRIMLFFSTGQAPSESA